MKISKKYLTKMIETINESKNVKSLLDKIKNNQNKIEAAVKKWFKDNSENGQLKPSSQKNWEFDDEGQ